METCLLREGPLEYRVSDQFHSEMLIPVMENLLLKARSGWDDYDEVYHCSRLIHAAERRPNLHMLFHTLRRDCRVAGLCLATRGAVDDPLFFPPGCAPVRPGRAAVLNYFHIAPWARGVGEHWLRDVILPHCAGLGAEAAYVKSSHPRVFSLYRRLGAEVGSYTASSDNGIFSRPGKLFRIPLEA